MQAIFTHHGTILYLEDEGVLCHGPNDAAAEKIAGALDLVLRSVSGGADCDLTAVEDWDGSYALVRHGLYGCAVPGRIALVFDRTVRSAWETFFLGDRPRIENACPIAGDVDEQFELFRRGAGTLLDARSSVRGDGRDQPSLLGLLRDDEVRFDRIALTAAEDCAAVERQLAEARARLAPDGSIFIEGTDHDGAALAIVAAACRRSLRPVLPSGHRQTPRLQILQPYRDRPSVPEDRVVLVAVSGEKACAEWAIASPATRAYAKKVGAELMVVEGDLGGIEGPLAKLHALNRVPAGRRVLLIDTDVMIRDEAPDLFDIVPDAAVGVFIEGLVSDRQHCLNNTLFFFRVESSGPYYANTGVMLVPSALLDVFKLDNITKTLYSDEMYEQNYFNALLHERGYPVFNISSLFNCIPALAPKALASAHFVHYAGGSIVPQTSEVWEETKSAVADVTLRTKRHLSGKDLRVYDLRDERARSGAGLDVFYQATRIEARAAELILRRGRLFYEGGSAPKMARFHCRLGDLPVGRYDLRVLLSERSYDEVMLGSCAEVPGEATAGPPPLSQPVTIELGSKVDPKSFQRVPLDVVDGSTVAHFVLEERRDVSCRIRAEAALHFYGLHLRGEVGSFGVAR